MWPWLLADWIVAEGARFLRQPVASIPVRLSMGGPRFLADFLKIVNPSLPFDRIVEADLEFLIHELNPTFNCYFWEATQFYTPIV